MKIKELIETLQKYPQTLDVLVLEEETQLITPVEDDFQVDADSLYINLK